MSERTTDLLKALTALQEQIEDLRGEVETTERSIQSGAVLGNRLRFLIALGSLASILFSAGVGYTVWMGANATDAEVQRWIESHNEDERAHPALLERTIRLEVQQESTDRKLSEHEKLQDRLDKRTEYLFEAVRWQMDVLEARSLKRKPPRKPERLKKLERELLFAR